MPRPKTRGRKLKTSSFSPHGLGFISEDRHLAGEHLIQNQILHVGIILHLIDHQMTDVSVHLRLFRRYFRYNIG